MKAKVYIDRFDSADHLRGRKRTYESVRAAVVEAGRFSVFEATETQRDAVMFTTLERDPMVVIERTMGYPWVGPIRWADNVKVGSR